MYFYPSERLQLTFSSYEKYYFHVKIRRRFLRYVQVAFVYWLNNFFIVLNLQILHSTLHMLQLANNILSYLSFDLHFPEEKMLCKHNDHVTFTEPDFDFVYNPFLNCLLIHLQSLELSPSVKVGFCYF